MKKYTIPRFRAQLVRERAVRYRANGPNEAAAILRTVCCEERGDREVMAVLYLDGKGGVVGCEMVGMGGSHGLAVTAKDVIRGAVIAGATGIVLGHNHPSGDPTPSQEDYAMTRSVERACDAVGISLCDHIVVTDDDAWSMLDHGGWSPEIKEDEEG